jgi:hypothetical protein
MYDKINNTMLLELFRIPAMSGNEDAVAAFIKKTLTAMEVPFQVDTYGNIYNVSNKNKPILSSHMDTVQRNDDEKLARFINIYELDDGSEILKGLGVIGGDDKCGIYAILEILRKNKDMNFVFSKEEETGCKGITAFAKEINLKDKEILYGIVIDRRFSTDIICTSNTYGTYAFQDELVKVGKDFGYSPTTGSLSDANTLKEYFSCANLSSGYYRPHSKQEYVLLKDLLKVINYVEMIINTIVVSYPPYVVAATKPYDYTNYKSKASAKARDWRNEDWAGEYSFYGKKEEKKKKIKSKTTSGMEKYFPVNTLCDCCNTTTECYRLDTFKTLTYVCATCADKIETELSDIKVLTDPYYYDEV